MQIFVNCKSTQVVDVAADATVADVYALVAAREGVAAEALCIVNQGRVLTEGTLAENGVEALATLQASVRVLGGKVHGSLARAGKVRGQTPKVEKGEAKKKSKAGAYPPCGPGVSAGGRGCSFFLLTRCSSFLALLPGRCKRRLQYNKRFINVVVGLGGKKKGPNAQNVPT